MSSSFERTLNIILENQFPAAITPEQFLNFMNAIAVSADHTRVSQALQRAATMSPEQLTSIINQSQSIGDIQGLMNAIRSNPLLAMPIAEIASKLFTPEGVEQIMAPLRIPAKQITDEDEDEDEYYDEGDDDDGHGKESVVEEPEEEYDVPGDYYSQGDDSGGH